MVPHVSTRRRCYDDAVRCASEDARIGHMQLAGARVVITGASRGIGEALAHRMAERGARVALVARSEEVIAKLAGDLDGDAYPADLTRVDEIGDLVSRITRDGPIDALVNNAGIDVSGAFTRTSDADVRDLIALNLTSPMLLCKSILPGMCTRRRGHIANISSLAASIATPGLAAYSTSKAGLSHFTAALRAELKGTGIGTTLVELGTVDTPMYESVTSYEPTRRAFRRFARLGFLPNLDPGDVASRIADAIARDRRHVRLPRRNILLPMLSESPRRIAEWALVGIASRDDAES
jgi:short-subunit dehydrogenase